MLILRFQRYFKGAAREGGIIHYTSHVYMCYVWMYLIPTHQTQKVPEMQTIIT